MKFLAATDIMQDGVKLLVEEESFTPGMRLIAEPMQFTLKEIKRGDWLEPTLTLVPQAAQSLMDALWSAGLRPADAKYPQEHVNAMKAHLEDMRRLVFKSEP